MKAIHQELKRLKDSVDQCNKSDGVFIQILGKMGIMIYNILRWMRSQQMSQDKRLAKVEDALLIPREPQEGER